jgi:hypothetical protein
MHNKHVPRLRFPGATDTVTGWRYLLAAVDVLVTESTYGKPPEPVVRRLRPVSGSSGSMVTTFRYAPK